MTDSIGTNPDDNEDKIICTRCKLELPADCFRQKLSGSYFKMCKSCNKKSQDYARLAKVICRLPGCKFRTTHYDHLRKHLRLRHGPQ